MRGNQVRSIVSGAPGEDLGTFAVQDPQPVRRLRHVECLKKQLCPYFGSIEIRNNLRDPIERCMSIVAGAYPVELNGDLHEDVSFDL